MDTTHIDFSKVDKDLGITIGNADAPLHLVSYINLCCPFCRKFHQQNKGLFRDYINQGKLKYTIKLFDRDKKDLRNSNILHQYIDYSDPEEANRLIDDFYSAQETFKHASETEVVEWVEQTLGLKKQDNTEIAQKIREEGDQASVQFIPTAYLEGHIFDEHEDYMTIREWLDAGYAKATDEKRDIPTVDTAKIKENQAVIVGNADASVTVYEYLNFRCPDAKRYFETVTPEMDQWIADGKIRRVIKHMPMFKKGLFKGNIMNQFIDYKNPEEAYEQIKTVYSHIGEWGACDFEGVFRFAEETLGYPYKGNKINASAVESEINKAHITVTPTVIIGDKVFDDTADPTEILEYIKKQ